MLRYLTAGESHGECLIATVEGMPAGLKVDGKAIDKDMALRQGGYGRGARMKIEKDRVHFLSGLRSGITIGSPIAMRIANKDDSINRMPSVSEPRPGHADLAGALKYHHRDIRSILERASARETAARVAVGALAKCLLAEFGIGVHAYVVMIGGIWSKAKTLTPKALSKAIAGSKVRCPDKGAEKKIIRAIDKAMKTRRPMIIVSSSGGARMMEAALSLMQLAKTSAKLAQLSDAGIPYLSILTDPTTGGVTASYAMLGDVNIAEPGALIGFAGPRVIKQTIGKDLPKGFQRSEFLLEKGFVDLVDHRKDMKETITRLLTLLAN